jgi:hypothetical protein
VCETLHQVHILTQLSPDDIAIMDAGTGELVRSGIAKRAKKIGDQAPDFELPNSNGEIEKLSDLLARFIQCATMVRDTSGGRFHPDN